MNKSLLFLSSVFAITAMLFLSCSKSDNGGSNPVCTNITKSFSTDVNPIIQTYCNQSNCHNPGSTNGPGALTNYSQVFNARNAIRGQVAAGLMPQNTTLTTEQKNTIICWIDNGALNN